ncbi:MAG: Ig-like domain-containing protein, partial [Solobacterium sp.]|nr:Ig-like domain-containing protein [Solobacterium sp.]
MMVTSISLSSISARAEGDSSEGSSITWEETDGKDIQSIEPKGKIEEAPVEAEQNVAKNVRVSIVLDGSSTLEAGYAAEGIASNSAAKNYRAGLYAKQQQMANTISQQALHGKKLDVVWNITLAANIISANVPVTSIERIKAVKGVKDVFVENQYEAVEPGKQADDPNMSVASDMTNTTQVWSNYTGAGQAVAIVDTGLDTDHRSFDPEAFDYAISTLDKEVDLIDKADIDELFKETNIYYETQGAVTSDDVYLSTKVPYAFNYVDMDLDVTHDNDTQEEHGSHVSGIAAANRYVKDAEGNFVDALTEVHTQGQAPDAQIIVMKVFGKGGGAYDSDYFVAIEDAIILGAASVNLSLGSSNAGLTTTSNQYMQILAELTQSDTVAVMSAGNNYDWSEPSIGELYADDANFATGGSPGSFTQPFTVASIDNDGYTGTPFKVGGNNIFFSDGSSAQNAPFTSIAGEYQYIAITGFGLEEEMAALKDVLAGKIAVVSRGNSSFFEKANAAVSNGAAGVVIYNNQPGTIGLNLKGYSYTAPVASVTQAEGQMFIANGEEKTINDATYYEGTVIVPSASEVTTEVYDAEYYTMSDFSSWGTTSDLNLKPEITAPGGNIYSVNGLPKGGMAYENMSGTSMAAPQITGITAVLRQYMDEADLEAKTGLTARQLGLSLLMSTAKPVVLESNKYYASLLKQGAGLVDVEAAANTKTAIIMKGTTVNGTAVDKAAYTSSYADGKVKALLGEDADRTGKYTVTFDVLNMTDEDTTVELDGEMFTQGIDVDEDGTAYLSRDTMPLGTAIVTFTKDGQPVAAKEEFDGFDFNGDGVVEKADAVALLEYVTGVRESINEEENSDIDNDGDTDTHDAYLALKKIGAVDLVVPAGETITVTANIDLNGSMDEVGSEELNGNYVEGLIFVREATTAEGVIGEEHSIPVFGYYGSWSEPSFNDKGSYLEYAYDEETRYPYMAAVFNNWQDSLTNETYIIKYAGNKDNYIFGGNPIKDDETYHPERNAISSKTTLVGPSYTQIRNAAGSKFTVTEGENVLSEVERGSSYAAYYYRNGATWYNTTSLPAFNYVPKDVEEGKTLTFTYNMAPEYYLTNEGKMDWDKVSTKGAMTISAVVDNTAPVVNKDASGVADGVLNIVASDNEYIAAVVLYDKSGAYLDAQYAGEADEKGAENTYAFTLAEDSSPYLYLEVYDYAMNKTVWKLNLNAAEEYVDPEVSITVSPESTSVIKGTSVQLTADVAPWGYNDNVTWTSADESIATVDETGLVTGVAVGTTTITVVPEADPEKSATAAVEVVSIEMDLNAIVWDENASVNFSTFNTGNLPNYTKLSGSMNGEFTSVARHADGTLYAVTLDTDNDNATLYSIDEANGYAPTAIGDVGVGVSDLAYAPTCDLIVGTYGKYVVGIDRTKGAYIVAFDYSSYVSNYLLGVTFLGTMETAYGTADVLGIMDTSGTLYQTAILPYNGSYGNFNAVAFGSAGAETSMDYWNSLHYVYNQDTQEEYFFWSRFEQAENKVDLIAIGYNAEADDYSAAYNLGSFAESVWPVSGLYDADASAADAGSAHLPKIEGTPVAAETQVTKRTPMKKIVKGSVNTVFAEADPIPDDSDDENVEKIQDYKVLTFTADEEMTNGMYTYEYDPAKLELIDAYGFTQYHAVNMNEPGKVVLGFISEEAVPADSKIAKLTFKVLNRDEDAYVTITTNDENEENPGTVEDLLVNVNQSVPTPVNVTSLTLSTTDLTVVEGETAEVTATIEPENATNKDVRWITTNPGIASVDENGVVTGVALGSTWLVATTVDGGFTGLCKVTVVSKHIPVTAITLNKTETTIRVGKTETLTATVTPEDATDPTITWSSSDTSVATVDANGVVTGVADKGIADASEAVITASAENGTVIAECKVYVEDPINAFVRRLYKLCLNRGADPG